MIYFKVEIVLNISLRFQDKVTMCNVQSIFSIYSQTEIKLLMNAEI